MTHKSRRKLTPRQKAAMVDKGLGLLDAFLRGWGNRKQAQKSGNLSGGIKPSRPCGKCD
jgi:hypothetical protein